MKEYSDKNVGGRFIGPEKPLPVRKEIHLKHYDYSQDGYYSVTICTHKQKPNIAEHKEIVKRVLFSLPKRFPGLNID